jgi:hypothetical protein
MFPIDKAGNGGVGSQLSQSGDSGPVEGRDGGSGLTAHGTITGSDTVNFWYSDLTYVLNALGVGLIVN